MMWHTTFHISGAHNIRPVSLRLPTKGVVQQEPRLLNESEFLLYIRRKEIQNFIYKSFGFYKIHHVVPSKLRRHPIPENHQRFHTVHAVFISICYILWHHSRPMVVTQHLNNAHTGVPKACLTFSCPSTRDYTILIFKTSWPLQTHIGVAPTFRPMLNNWHHFRPMVLVPCNKIIGFLIILSIISPRYSTLKQIR